MDRRYEETETIAFRLTNTNDDARADMKPLEDFPRVRLAHSPTPLEPLERLSAYLNGPKIYIKRDDQTGLATGGNKARKLEFLVGEALAQGADTLVTTGGVQSNHARQTAAAAARLGLRCELLLPRIVAGRSAAYETSGNVLLDQLCGATLHLLPPEDYRPEAFESHVARLRAAGRKPYFIPTGGSTPLGALGYVVAMKELASQLKSLGVAPSAIIVGSGSCGTHAGILAGLALDDYAPNGHAVRLIGVSVSGKSAEREAMVIDLANGALALLEGPGVRKIPPEKACVLDQYVGPGYGQPTPAMVEAVRLVASLEGILLDPVYTGKAMAGLIDQARQGKFTARDAVIFWHTGGTVGLFAYPEAFAPGA
jgi:D-cysteine desulfhydrase family pyridoxal phosphate-dependent enzyme